MFSLLFKKKSKELHVPKQKKLYHLTKASHKILNQGLQTDRSTTSVSIEDNSMTREFLLMIITWSFPS